MYLSHFSVSMDATYRKIADRGSEMNWVRTLASSGTSGSDTEDVAGVPRLGRLSRGDSAVHAHFRWYS